MPPGASQWIGGLNSDMGGFLPFTASQIQVMERTLDMIEDIANIRLVRVGTGTTGTAAYSDQAELLLGNYTTGAATSYGGWGGYRFGSTTGSIPARAKPGSTPANRTLPMPPVSTRPRSCSPTR